MNPNTLYSAPLDGATWYKSSYTASNDQCVEIAELSTLPAVAIRDSKNTNLPASRVSATGWAAFVTALKAGTLVTA
ncbi:DUF397 domain-containing protein [Embleya sp. NPDC059237]|uniref:DUF397 domain-containing protein n=1 Tax=Embleya sp. NPDC059237 TaxID=3346784 RepID=UPI00369BB91D